MNPYIGLELRKVLNEAPWPKVYDIIENAFTLYLVLLGSERKRVIRDY